LKVREVDDFQGLEKIWNCALKKNLLGDNVFLTWEWLSIWWEHFGKGRKLLVLLVEDGDELLAIAPLMLSKYKLPSFGTVKKIEFLGTRTSDYNNFIILKKEMECLRLIIEYLVNSVTDWNWIELKEIPETAENTVYLERLFFASQYDLKLKRRVCNICPYISLPGSFDQLMNGLSKNMRQNLNRYLRRISKKHRVALKRYDEMGLSVRESMEVFIRLNERRWALEGQLGSFRSKEDAFRNFHMDIAECFANEGWLGLYFLTADDEPVSVQYTFEYGRKMYYYLAGYEPRFAEYSVGNLIIMFLLEKCVKNGFTEYDMMRGNELYKLLWTSTCRRNFEVRFVRKNVRDGFLDWITWTNAINSLAGKLKLSLKREGVA